MKTASPLKLNRTPFADLMLHPDKLDVVLKATSNNALPVGNNEATTMALSQSKALRKSSNHFNSELKETEFYLNAPSAASVKLAADFTEWEKFPLDMIKSDDGEWSIFIPLPPGNHAYRFIVDGRWCDDPHSELCEPNPFGTFNAVVRIP